jgi:hypothetical protein
VEPYTTIEIEPELINSVLMYANDPRCIDVTTPDGEYMEAKEFYNKFAGITLTVNSNKVHVKYIGFATHKMPGEPWDEGDIYEDVYKSEDGRMFVQLYITEKWDAYDQNKHGRIWTRPEWDEVNKIKT